MSVASELILQITNEFQDLKKEYTLFLNDANPIEPYEKRESLLKKVKRLRNLTNLRTEEQFRTDNLCAKVQTHMELWARQTERKYAGTLRPRRKKTAPKEEKRKPENKQVVIGNPGQERDRVVELYDEYMRLNLLVGARKMANFAKFTSFIENQTRKIRDNKGAERVQYEVMVQDQKVVIKSKSLKKS